MLVGHGPSHEMGLFVLQPPCSLKLRIKASCISVKHKIEEGTNIYLKLSLNTLSILFIFPIPLGSFGVFFGFVFSSPFLNL